MRVVVLLSGGMDSTTLLYHEHAEHEVVAALSFHYGSKHNDLELPFAQFHAERLKVPHHIIELEFISKFFSSHLLKEGGAIPEGHYEEPSMKQTVVPFRNGIMLSIAAGFAESVEAEAVSIAAHAGDHAVYPDCRAEFMQHFQAAVQAGTYANLTLRSPFVTLRKEDISARGEELGVDFSKTWSCYKGLSEHCGRCGTCVERKEAFALSKVKDPTIYLA